MTLLWFALGFLGLTGAVIFGLWLIFVLVANAHYKAVYRSPAPDAGAQVRFPLSWFLVSSALGLSGLFLSALSH